MGMGARLFLAFALLVARAALSHVLDPLNITKAEFVASTATFHADFVHQLCTRTLPRT